MTFRNAHIRDPPSEVLIADVVLMSKNSVKPVLQSQRSFGFINPLIPLPRCHAETATCLISSAHTGQLITPGDGSADEERVLAQESGSSRQKQGAEEENKTWRETFADASQEGDGRS